MSLLAESAGPMLVIPRVEGAERETRGAQKGVIRGNDVKNDLVEPARTAMDPATPSTQTQGCEKVRHEWSTGQGRRTVGKTTIGISCLIQRLMVSTKYWATSFLTN